jgi:hypothetical protein
MFFLVSYINYIFLYRSFYYSKIFYNLDYCLKRYLHYDKTNISIFSEFIEGYLVNSLILSCCILKNLSYILNNSYKSS